MTTPSGILLDFYGTVVHEDGAVVASVCDEVHASAASPESVPASEIGSYWWRTFTAMCAASVGPTFRTQRDLEHASLQRTIEHFGSTADAAQLSQQMFAYWQQPPLFKDARAFLAQIDMPVCVVSNIDRQDIEAAIAHHGLPVELIVTSEDVRSYKPRSECFRAGLEALALPASEVVHVGDSLSSDVAGANALQIPAVWVNRAGNPRQDSHALLAEISDLAGLTRTFG